MEIWKAKLLQLSGLILGTSYLSASYDKSFAADKPIHSAIAVLALCGGAILLSNNLFPPSASSTTTKAYLAIPLQNANGGHPSRPSSPAPGHDERDNMSWRQIPPKTLLKLFLLVLAICMRVEVLHQVIKNVQCAKNRFTYYEVFLPFVAALYRAWQTRADRSTNMSEHWAGGTVNTKIYLRVVSSPWILACATLLLGWSAALGASSSAGPKSTYICAGTLSNIASVPFLQFCGFSLDVLLTVLLTRIMGPSSEGKRTGGNGISIVGWACIFSAIFYSIVGVVVYVASPDSRHWILSIPQNYLMSLFEFAFVASITIVLGMRAASHIESPTVLFLVVFSSSYANGLIKAWSNYHPYPPTSDGWSLLAVLGMLFAAAVCFLGETLSQDSVPSSKVAFSRLHSTLFAVPLMLFLARASLWYSHSGRVNFHPIDLLIYEGKVQHTAWLSQASASNSFFTASRKYKQRYHQPPPPNFNKWYEYASSRSAVVIDDFDNIYDDLLPFWSLSPSDIRRYTWDILSQSNNGVGGISIRDGKVDVLPGTPGTHRWMLDGAIRMIENFVEWLPDMDLALNLNDEPRVAVPYRDIEKMRSKGRQPRLVGANKITKFSDNRAGGWAPVTEEQFPDTSFEMLSFQRTFYEYGSVGCPPLSPARRQRLWDTSQLCMTCTYPHSLGQFVSNWTLSGDVCHQPDLADLHGLYLSPAAFQGSHKLFPIFSQSKAGGFNDIRFPSPWNYMDKVAYAPNEVYPDPSFRDKKVSLFWRGVTSEGVSPGTGVWKGMSRQRLVHLASNPTTPQHILLPVFEGAKRFAYTPVSPSDLKRLLSTDVHFVDPIVRCGGRDCTDQAAEFGFGDKVDFQEHWGYKFLFDADGAGFSGRFLPFLQSRSLPFKSALFREWWEGRLTPWLHFVPVDLRMHGLWSTLAYFAGVDGMVGGRKVKWEPKGREAEMIAEEGREWAGKVLRKEDMEVYFFRLLLEWGRLTDDRRDELGMYIP